MDTGSADGAPRYFTVEEADALVPVLNLVFGRVSQVQAELGPLVESLGARTAVDLLRGLAEAPAGREGDVARLRALAGEITSAVTRLNALGCLVKDLETGLVDFDALLDGEPVLLCWQFGERAVTHWHTHEAGFAGRLPIEGVEAGRPEFPS
jgi:hypothetical protein